MAMPRAHACSARPLFDPHGACVWAVLGGFLLYLLRRLAAMRADLERAHLINKAHEQVADFGEDPFCSAADLAAADPDDTPLPML